MQRNGEAIPVPPAKSLELLCYLLVHHERAHTRDALAEVLWPGWHPTASKRYLRQALWRLNSALGPAGSRPLLVADQDRVSIDAEVAWLDVRAFERAYAAARDTAGQRFSERQARELMAAIELYRGDLLATCGYDWASHEHDRLLLTYLAMLEQLMDYCEAQHLFGTGMAHAQVVLRHDRARETTHRRLMRLNYAAGDRTSAIRQYERCAAAMADEFGIEPSAETVALYEQICADRVARVVPNAQGDGPRELPADALADVHVRLDQIQASLATLHRSLLDGTRAGIPAGNGSMTN